MKTEKQKGWAIAGHFGLYTGWTFLKADAIKNHTDQLGRTWKYCKAKGDYATRIEIHFEPRTIKEK